MRTITCQFRVVAARLRFCYVCLRKEHWRGTHLDSLQTVLQTTSSIVLSEDKHGKLHGYSSQRGALLEYTRKLVLVRHG